MLLFKSLDDIAPSTMKKKKKIYSPQQWNNDVTLKESYYMMGCREGQRHQYRPPVTWILPIVQYKTQQINGKEKKVK